MRFVLFFLALIIALPAQAAKVTDYAAAGAVQAGDVFYCVRSSTDYQCTGSNIATYVLGADAEIAALAGLTSAADKCVVFSGSGTAITFDCTSYGRGLLNVANEAAFKALINAEAGVDYQAYDAGLASLTAVDAAADRIGYTTGANTWAALTTTSYGRSLLGVADETALKTLINAEAGVDFQAYDAQLADIAGVTPTDNAVVIGNGANFTVESGVTFKTSMNILTCFSLYPTTVAGDLVAGTKLATEMVRSAFTVTAVYASINVGGTTSAPTFDINENGVSILGTKLTIDATETDSSTAASAATITDTALAAHAQISVDVDSEDSGNTAAGAEVQLCGYYN